MFTTQIPVTRNPTVRNQTLDREPESAATEVPAPRTSDVVLGFEPGRRKLPGSEQLVLERWISGWMAWRPQSIVVMAHDISASSATRMARLRNLRDAVERLGVPRESIKYTDRVLSALPVVGGDERRIDAVVLKVIDPPSEAQHVRSVASCFDALAPSS